MPITPLVPDKSRPAPSWQNTFNASLRSYPTIVHILELARAAHYPYFTALNDGKVYITPNVGSWAETACRVSDLDPRPVTGGSGMVRC